MCGVIVVDAGRSRSTNLGHDAYVHDYLKFYQLPNSNLFTHCLLFSREKPLVKLTAARSLSHIIFLCGLFSIIFNLSTTSYFWRRFYFAFFTLHLYHKNTKNIILSYVSDLTLVGDHDEN